jgi:sortase A
MKPDNPDSSQSGMPLSNQGSNNDSSRQAAERLIMNQIDNIYEKSDAMTDPTNTSEPKPTPLEDVNPYQRTHTPTEQLRQTNNLKQYHTAWQNYYQKYYEGYYTHHLNKVKREIGAEKPANNQYFSDKNILQDKKPDEPLSKDEALFDMKQNLLGKVQRSASKIRKNRHFVPIVSGIIVVLIFAFLQYNRLIISNVMAYVSPGNIDPQNIVIDPNANVQVSADPKLIIPKINVDVPVYYDIGNDHDSQMAAMAKGVAQFAIPGASSHPGEVGNTVLSGHSSNDLLDGGDYKFIFAQLDKLNPGDTIYVNYKSVRYTYVVTKKQVVKPNDVSALVYNTNKPILTLITCTPVGTSLNRLLVTAEQVSPDPAKAVQASGTGVQTIKSIPGNTPSFIERLFGAK